VLWNMTVASTILRRVSACLSARLRNSYFRFRATGCFAIIDNRQGQC
jgi:hypothetical protein